MIIIYGLVDPRVNIIRYVGKATDISVRIRRHIHTSKYKQKDHRAAWVKSLLNDGVRPQAIVLQQTDEDHWREHERLWIKQLRDAGWDLTNHSDGGEGVMMTPEVRAKMRAAWETREPVSDETRAKISSSQTGKVRSDEARVSYSAAAKRRTYSDATRLKMSAAAKARVVTDATKEKLSASVKAARSSPEFRATVSEKLKGRPVSEETRKKLSESNKRTKALKKAGTP